MTAVFADEIVTAAKVRYLRLPGLAGELALITLDNGHDRTRPSAFGPAGPASLDAALDDIATHSPTPVAIAVTGKPFIAAVGADLSGVPSITSAADAREIARAGHWVFRRLKDAAIPTFAFVNGAAMGGGLEAVQDVDLCMLLGAGWPFWLGGISAHLDRVGVSGAVRGAPVPASRRGLAPRLSPSQLGSGDPAPGAPTPWQDAR